MAFLVSLELPPAMPVFWGWCILTAIHFAIGIANCRLESGPLAVAAAADPRFPSERESDARFRETYRQRFGASEIVYVLFINAAGGVLLYFATAGKFWAMVPLVPASLWLIYSHAALPFTLRAMNPKLAGPWDWAYGLTGAAAWAYCAAVAVFRWKIGT